jgi:murein DD-endopeptidase MepM/ murein hydrolase activator NlpD
MWSNPDLENAPDLLSVGQQLTILPLNGVYHQVGEGDTLQGIADTFKADPAAIINYLPNQLDPDNPIITLGQWVVVPGGSKPFIPRAVTAYTGPIPDDASTGTGEFAWPASGTIYQGFFPWHPAIDIAAYLGAPVLAADSGYVIEAGWSNVGYGYNVVIDHGNGFQTLYAHLNAYYVDVGDNVAQGQQIGEMGNTGNATGPHLHFEVRQNTVQRNPIGILP